MIKLSYFISKYSESDEMGVMRLPVEMQYFPSRTALLVACYERLGGGRTCKQFLGSMNGDIEGFRRWKQNGRPNHPHLDILSSYLKKTDARERLWREIEAYLPRSTDAEESNGGSEPPPASEHRRHIRNQTAGESADDARKPFDDEAEFCVQNARKEMAIRQKQSLFRRRVLENFGGRCCITGIVEPCLLVASHIIPWRCQNEIRLDPRNGLLLNVLWDRLFDQGLVTFTDELDVVVIPWLAECSQPLQNILQSIRGKRARKPRRMPLPKYLDFHRENIFQRSPSADAVN